MTSNNEVICEKCTHLWIYSPDASSPYGEISCGKGYWDGVEDPNDLLEPLECVDWEKKDD